jgi:hypothetical protein
VLALPEDMLRDEVEANDRPAIAPLAEAPDPVQPAWLVAHALSAANAESKARRGIPFPPGISGAEIIWTPSGIQ